VRSGVVGGPWHHPIGIGIIRFALSVIFLPFKLLRR
jgi:hypothetical protein